MELGIARRVRRSERASHLAGAASVDAGTVQVII